MDRFSRRGKFDDARLQLFLRVRAGAVTDHVFFNRKLIVEQERVTPSKPALRVFNSIVHHR